MFSPSTHLFTDIKNQPTHTVGTYTVKYEGGILCENRNKHSPAEMRQFEALQVRVIQNALLNIY